MFVLRQAARGVAAYSYVGDALVNNGRSDGTHHYEHGGDCCHQVASVVYDDQKRPSEMLRAFCGWRWLVEDPRKNPGQP